MTRAHRTVWQLEGHICSSCRGSAFTKPKAGCICSQHLRYYSQKLIRAYKKNLNWILSNGAECTCCGFNIPEAKVHGMLFLQKDHIHGRKNSAEMRILCAACNVSMGYGESICLLHKWELHI